jgi:hypothetical protein
MERSGSSKWREFRGRIPKLVTKIETNWRNDNPLSLSVAVVIMLVRKVLCEDVCQWFYNLHPASL